MSTRHKFYLITTLFFVMNLAVTYGEIFRYALFLSTYPSHWLSYFFLAAFLLNMFVFFAITPLLRKRQRVLDQTIIISLIGIGFIFTGLSYLNLYWVPFVFSLYFSLLYPILSVILFNMASDTFGIRDVKQYTSKLLGAATVGVLVGAYTTPFFTSYFSVDSTLYLTLGALCVIEALLILTPSGSSSLQDEKGESVKQTLSRYPILSTVLPMIVFMSVGYYIASYLLFSKLSDVYDREKISSFLGYFVGTMNLASYFVQSFLTPVLLNRLGVISLFISRLSSLSLARSFLYFMLP